MNTILFINFIAYLSWLLFTWLKDKKVTVYLLLVSFFTFIAFMGFFTVLTGIYQDTFGDFGLKRLKIEPYIYCFITYVILLYPFRHLEIDFSNNDFLFSHYMKVFVNIWVIFFTIYTALRLGEAISSISSGLGEAYENRHINGESLFVYHNVFLAKIIGYGTFLATATVPIIMCYALIGVTRKKNTLGYSLFLITLCFLPLFSTSLGMGSRGGLFMNILCLLFFVILLRNYTPKKFIRIIEILFISILSIVLFYSWIITVYRVSDGASGFESICRYFGEPFPNLGGNYWNQVLVHPMGTRLYPNLFGIELNGSTQDIYDYWYIITGVPVLNFKTYFGDLYIEFDVIGAFVFVTLGTLLMLAIVKNKSLGFLKLPCVYYYYQLCVYAFAGMTKEGHHATFELFIVFTVIFVLSTLNHLYENNINSKL